MRIAGISRGTHDAVYCLLDDKEILYASHSERYSQVKNDSRLHRDMVRKSDVICYYEKPFGEKH